MEGEYRENTVPDAEKRSPKINGARSSLFQSISKQRDRERNPNLRAEKREKDESPLLFRRIDENPNRQIRTVEEQNRRNSANREFLKARERARQRGLSPHKRQI